MSPKKLSHYVLIGIAFQFLISCGSTPENDSDLTVITPEYDGVHGSLDMASKIELIPLHGLMDSANTFLNTIIMLVEKESGYFLMNVPRNNPEIIKFGLDGQFQTALGGIGKGPGEYLRIRSIGKSPNGIHALDVASNNILTYSDEGDFINATSFENLNYYEVIQSIENGYLGLRSPEYPLNDTQEKNHLVIYMDSSFSTIDTFLPIELKDRDQRKANEFYPLDENKFLYVQFFNDSIYTVSKNGVEATYYIDFGDRKLPNDMREGLISWGTLMETLPRYQKSDFLLVRYVYDNGEYLLLHVHTPTSGGKIIVYNKENDEQYHFDLGPDGNDLGNPLGVSKDGAFFFAFDKDEPDPSETRKELLARLPETPYDYSKVLVKYYP